MNSAAEKIAMAKQLQAEINAMQGLTKAAGEHTNAGFAPFNTAFPGHTFPLSTVHEFISHEPAEAACTSGFISSLAGMIANEGRPCLWISNESKVFPAGLKHFQLEPDHVIFVTATKPKEALWIMEEALKCDALSMIIGEIKELGFTESRRLQMAAERSGVTCFIHRYQPRGGNAVACAARWKITPMLSLDIDALPGIGHNCWDVALLKVKNGKPVSWQIGWSGNHFIPVTHKIATAPQELKRHAI